MLKYSTCGLMLLKLLLSFTPSFAQQPKKESADEYLARMKNMVDSIKKAKQEAKATGTKPAASGASAAAVTVGKYGTKKAAIESAYNFLNPAEKEKVKNFPAVPEAFRTNLDAQAFLDKLTGIDFNAAIAKYSKEKSAALTGYCISYQGVKQKAETILKEAARLKAAFEKNNPSVKLVPTLVKPISQSHHSFICHWAKLPLPTKW